MSLLDRALILELHGAAVKAGLHRKTLLAGIAPAFVASLSEAPNLASQLLSDLGELNRTPRLCDNTVPLKQWLQNAIVLTSARPEGEVFGRALDLLEQQPGSSAEPKSDRKRAVQQSGRVTILFLGANPSNLTERALGHEVREIVERLRAADLRDCFEIVQAWAVRTSDLQQCLLRHRPVIVHFSGHGTLDGQIMLEDKQGRAMAMSTSAIARLFEILRDNIRCVVLNACASKVQAEAIAKYIDCVVGMSAAIDDASAIAFSGALYQALGFGRSLKEAFKLGCLEIDMENQKQADVPTLICREGVLPEEVWLVSTGK
jgi:hypothetical protein